MRKKFFAMYALAGALVASPIFTSCVDDTVSSSVEALRGAKVEALKAQAAYDNALAQAALINANANAAYNNAQAEYKKADAAYRQAEAKAKELENQIKEGTLEADLAAAIAEADSAKLAAEQALAIAKIEAEKALEMAKWEAQQDFWDAEKEHANAQAAYEKYLAGLDNETKRHAENINDNINAILNGGAYFGWNTSGNWSSIRSYGETYAKANTYNSINALIAGLVEEKADLIELEYGLVDMKEYIAEQKKANDEKIATQKALIEKYTELQADATNREAMEKAYEEAKEKQYDLYTQYTEKQADAYNANMAYLTHMLGFFENEVQDYINTAVAVVSDDEAISGEDSEEEAGVEYLTKQENEGSSLPLYTYTADDAAALATAIAEAKKVVDAEDVENARELAIKEAELTPLKKQYDEIIASEGYKAALKELEDAVAEAKAAFDKTPTEDLKEALEIAEEALATFDYSLVAEEEEETEGETETVAEGETTEGEEGETEEEEVYETLSELESAIKILEGEIEELKNPQEATEAEAALKKLEELQSLLTGDAMKEYTALCEEALKLEAAYNALAIELATIKSEWEYCGTLMSNLEAYIGENGILPDYEALIEAAEAQIQTAERANEALVYGDNDVTNVDGENEAAQEKLIAEKKAEIAAMEAELEVRKAEYEAEVAALNALIGAEEE